ncbi:hypothetical protein QBC44DRAFT_121780 [Cladorrhinum sp. PSN332]|nr:hypothetical protein QBC44DRAFT_121780 [Cladorrhinum sp. PSN332]
MPSKMRSIFGPLLPGSSSSSKKEKATTADAATQANTGSPSSSSPSATSGIPDHPTAAAAAETSSSRPHTPTPTYSTNNPPPPKQLVWPPRVVSSRPAPPALFKHARSNDPVLLRYHNEWTNWYALAMAQATLCGINVFGETFVTRPQQTTLFQFHPWLLTEYLATEQQRARVRTIHNPRGQNEWTEWIPNGAMEKDAEEKGLVTEEQRSKWAERRDAEKNRLDQYTRGLWALNEWKGWVRRTVSSEILRMLGDMEGQDVRGVVREVRRVLGRMVEKSKVEEGEPERMEVDGKE